MDSSLALASTASVTCSAQTQVHIAVIDTGCANSNAPLPIMSAVGFTGGYRRSPVVVTNDADDDHGHGTTCVTLIAQAAPDAVFTVIKILDSRLRAHPLALIAAIDHARETGAHVLNLSLATAMNPYVRALCEACDRAADAGVVIMAARGPGPLRFPASFASVIGVRAGRVPRGSFRFVAGAQVECIANGCGLAASEGSIGKSSYATARMSGIVAGLLEHSRTIGVTGVRSLLVAATCRKQPAGGPNAR